MDVSVGWVLKGLQLLHLILWLLRDVCCADKGFLLQSVRQWQGDSSVYDKSLPTILERVDWMVFLRGSIKQFHFCLNLADFLVHLLIRVVLSWCTISIYHYAMYAF